MRSCRAVGPATRVRPSTGWSASSGPCRGSLPSPRAGPGQRPDLFCFPGLTARPWYERDEFPWIPTLEHGWGEVCAELDELLEHPETFTPFVGGDGSAYREQKFGLRDRPDAWTV